MKHILITGSGSFIGTSFEKYIKTHFPDQYQIDVIDLKDGSWKQKSFFGYDVVFHVAGIVHIKEERTNEHFYYEVNRDLTFQVAEKAKIEKVKQFVFLSSMSVYGKDSGVIKKDTKPKPKTYYGISKLQAEEKINSLKDNDYKICILRPPMVYGVGCKGNYHKLVKFINNHRFFPMINNKKSLIDINNLVKFVEHVIRDDLDGIFLPQDPTYIRTIDLAREIAKENNKKIYFSYTLGLFVFLLRPFFKKIKKAFGTLIYSDDM